MKMRAAFVADVHIANHRQFGGPLNAGINKRAQLCLDAFSSAVDLAVQKQCTHFVVLGDLFDSDKPEPQLIAAVQDILLRLVGESITVILLVGNHDQHTESPKDHALSPLEIDDNIYVIDRAQQVNKILCIPYTRDLNRALKQVAHLGASILALHVGVKDGQTPEYLANAHDSIGVDTLIKHADRMGVSLVACGNWHNAETWAQGSVVVEQVGALCPTGWDNPGLDYGYVVIFDGETLQREQVPGPRFVRATSLANFHNLRDANPKNTLFVELDAHAKQDVDAFAEIKDLGGHRIRANVASAREAAQTAATAVRGVPNIDAAIAAYVKGRPHNELVTEAEIVAAVRGYLQ